MTCNPDYSCSDCKSINGQHPGAILPNPQETLYKKITLIALLTAVSSSEWWCDSLLDKFTKLFQLNLQNLLSQDPRKFCAINYDNLKCGANIKAIFVALKGCPLLINLEVETYATMYQGNASVVIRV